VRWRTKGSTRNWRRRRLGILERDGYRCTHREQGERCTATTLLEVHHLRGDDVLLVPDEELTTLCRKHHRGF
jgi:5-methylcytosine-specific restriction endonuclease McrA